MYENNKNTFMEAVSEYLSYIGVNENSNKTDGTYSPKIYAFSNYLINERHFDNDNLKDTILRINNNDLINSARYYIENSKEGKRVEKVCNVKYFFIVINEFFKFLATNGIENSGILADFDSWEENTGSFKRAIVHLKKEFNLSDDIDEQQPFTTDEIEMLLMVIECNIERSYSSIKKEYQNDSPITDERYYRRFSMCLVLKLIILTGIKLNKIPSIKRNHFIEKRNIIQIDGFEIYLPLKFREQLINYLKLRTKICKNSKQQLDDLFVWIDGSDGNGVPYNNPSSNSYYSAFLNYTLTKSGITGLYKYVVIEMIKNKIDINMIKSLTGHGPTLIENCINIIFSDSNMQKLTSLQIRNLDFYDRL